MRTFFVVVFLLSILSIAAQADVFVVNQISDIGDDNPGDGICETATGNGECSIRAAVQEANALDGADEIEIPEGDFLLDSGVGDNTAIEGDLDVLDDLKIRGSGSDLTILDANRLDRFFEIHGVEFEISEVTIQNGSPPVLPGGGALLNRTGDVIISNSTIINNIGTQGGGLANFEGNLSLTNVLVRNNSVGTGAGGGIWSDGTLSIENSEISFNRAGIGAGLYNSRGRATTTDTLFDRNVVRGVGGGILNSEEGNFTLTSSTITGNTGDDGGAIFNFGAFTINRSTISDNFVRFRAGGIFNNGGNMTINDSTITLNRSNRTEGGIANEEGGTTRLSNTILAGNSTIDGRTPDCGGQLISLGSNLIGNSRDCLGFASSSNSDLVGTAENNINPRLGVLDNNGGATPTHSLLPGSPAINAGSGCASRDQRGETRPRGGACDIGAFES